jgi:two-component system C4-dicarboxylate transport sensor histidine kinase DctB
MSITGATRSWLAAVIAMALGLGLYVYDDWCEDLPDPRPQAFFNALEILAMGPGMGALAFLLSERLRQKEQRLALEREQRFRFLGRVAAGVAHEVRNPLHNIRLLTDELRASSPAETHEMFDRVGDNLERLEHATLLIYELAKPPRPIDLDLGAVDLAPLVASVVDEVRRRHGAQARIALATPPAAPVVGGRRESLRIVLHNLVRNAVEAAAGAEVSIDWADAGPALDLVIANPGALPPGLLAEGGEVASSKPDGLGIGVSIARHLATLCGGSLDYLARPGEVVARLRLQRAA